MLILFVHGALVRDADWWWHRMPAPLARYGFRTAAVELPSCVGRGDRPGAAGGGGGGVAGADAPGALGGHSSGGTVTTAGGAGAAQLVYVTSVLARAGRSHAESGSGRPAPWVRPNPDGTVELVGADIRELFFADCDHATCDEALEHRARQDAAALTSPVSTPAWRTVPSTYVVCAEDRAVPAEDQRAAAAGAGRVLELPAGHHPFLAFPELFAETLRNALEPGKTK